MNMHVPRRIFREPRDHCRGLSRRNRRPAYNFSSHRIHEIERIRHKRGHDALDTDDADMYRIPIAQQLRRGHNAHTHEELLQELQRREPKAALDKLLEAVDYVIDENSKTMSADDLGKRLKLTAAERTAWKIRTIGACDQTKAQRAKLRRQNKRVRDRLRAAEKRKADGMTPRQLWLSNRLTATKPWAAEGISRATWYRQNTAKQKPVDGETGVSPNGVFYLLSDGPVSQSPALAAMAVGLPTKTTTLDLSSLH